MLKLARNLDQTVPSRRQWRRWGQHEPALAQTSYRDLRAELADRAGYVDRNDELLAALIRIAQQQDRYAAQVIAACLLPGLLARTRKNSHALDVEDTFSELTVALYRHVQRYDTILHPRYVAANLLQRATKDLRRAAAKARTDAEQLWASDQLPEVADPSGVVTFNALLLLTTAIDAGVLSRADATLIYLTVIGGASLEEAGRQLDIGYEAAKKRRQRALRRWSIWWRHGLRPVPGFSGEPDLREAA